MSTPLRESTRPKGKKAKKKKAAGDGQRYTDDQDVDAAQDEEESKNAISEAPVEEEATAEDHNLQLPGHDWAGGSGDVQQPAHGAHPSFSPGDAQAMLLIQDQRYNSEDKEGQDIGHQDDSDPGAHASEGEYGGRQPDSSEDEADFGEIPDRFAAGSYRAVSLDGSKLQAEGSESHAQSKDVSQDIAAEPTGEQENEEVAGTEEQAAE